MLRNSTEREMPLIELSFAGLICWMILAPETLKSDKDRTILHVDADGAGGGKITYLNSTKATAK